MCVYVYLDLCIYNIYLLCVSLCNMTYFQIILGYCFTKSFCCLLAFTVNWQLLPVFPHQGYGEGSEG